MRMSARNSKETTNCPHCEGELIVEMKIETDGHFASVEIVDVSAVTVLEVDDKTQNEFPFERDPWGILRVKGYYAYPLNPYVAKALSEWYEKEFGITI